MRTKYKSLKKNIYAKTVNIENKRNTKTNILSFCLGSLGVSNSFGLRRGNIWSLAFILFLVIILTLGSLNFFPLTSIWVGICWDFHRSRKGLISYRDFRYWGWLLWGRRVRTWERLDIGIIIYALRPSEAGISRDPSGIKGFTPSNVAVVPGNSRKFFSQPTLSLLHPQSIRSLLLDLSCLF